MPRYFTKTEKVLTKNDGWIFQKSIRLIPQKLKFRKKYWMSFPEICLCPAPENWIFGNVSGWVFQDLPIRVNCEFYNLIFLLRLSQTFFHLSSPQPEQHAQTVRVPLAIVMVNSNPVLTITWMDSMLNKWKFQKIFLKIHLIVRKYLALPMLPINFRFCDRHGNIWTGSE